LRTLADEPRGDSRIASPQQPSRSREIGFRAITEIKLFQPKGLRYVGPLPAEVRNHTSYVAGVMAGARSGCRGRVRALPYDA
jgi:hypothetical protein